MQTGRGLPRFSAAILRQCCEFLRGATMGRLRLAQPHRHLLTGDASLEGVGFVGAAFPAAHGGRLDAEDAGGVFLA